jgi:predicted O-linked N-acetylglucosamine transferase (SPINDLY family)
VFFNPRDPERPLRIGIVSPDLRTHSVAFFLEPLLRHLDRSSFAVFLYHNHHTEDAASARLRTLASKWTNISALDHASACDLIRKDAPDILLDLAGHSSLNRLPVFAMRPAPVLATYLGYPHSTGLRQITYRLVDSITDPEGVADSLASEKLVRFSDCAWLYEPPAEAPEPALESQGITFGSFNNFLKASRATLFAWARILERLPTARLVLKSPNLDDPGVAALVSARLEEAGLPIARVDLLGLEPRLDDHLARYRSIDVALDTFPYNGTTTTCEALWMGVPVVSVRGDRHAARVGESLLRAVGHAEWCASDVDGYVDLAVRLAQDRHTLAHIR